CSFTRAPDRTLRLIADSIRSFPPAPDGPYPTQRIAGTITAVGPWTVLGILAIAERIVVAVVKWMSVEARVAVPARIANPAKSRGDDKRAACGRDVRDDHERQAKAQTERNESYAYSGVLALP